MTPSETTGWIDGPTRLRVRRRGRGGPSILFLHSLAGSSTQWARQLRHRADERRAVAVDLRGHGESSVAGDGDYSLTAMAADVHRVVERLDLAPVLLVGHSFGAGVATVYAGANPDRVAGLLLADPIGEQRQAPDEIAELLARLDADYRGTVTPHWRALLSGAAPGVERTVLRDLERATPKAVTGGLRATLAFDPGGAFDRYRGPARILRTPMNDFPYSLHRAVDGIPTTVVEGTSHWLQLDRPDVFNDLLDGFIDAALGGGPGH